MADDEQTIHELADGWLEYQRLARGHREQRKALEQGKPTSVHLANEKVRDRIDAGGQAALELVLALLSAGGWDEVSTVAAGPLEDLIHQHGDELIDDIEPLARQDDRFRAALGSVWLARGTLPVEVEQRFAQWMSII